MATHAIKDSRMEFKTPSSVKELLSKAAALSGMDLTSFVLGTAQDRAAEVVARHQSLALTTAEHQRFLALLNNPPKQTEKLAELMRSERLPER